MTQLDPLVRWRSPFQPLSSGHVNSPSQKGHNIADLPGVEDFFKILFRGAREFSKQKVAPECEDENIQEKDPKIKQGLNKLPTKLGGDDPTCYL